MPITEELEKHGSGVIRLRRSLPAGVRAVLDPDYGGFSHIYVTPQRVRCLLDNATLASIVATNSAGSGGYLMDTTDDGSVVEVRTSGWAEILGDEREQIAWGYAFGLWNAVLTLAGWRDRITGTGLLCGSGTATAGAGAPSMFAQYGDATATQVTMARRVADVFKTNWRVRLSATGVPTLDFLPLDSFTATGAFPAALLTPDVPAGANGSLRVLAARGVRESDVSERINRVYAISGDDILTAAAVMRQTPNMPFRTWINYPWQRERNLAANVPLDDPAPPPGDTTTVASLTAIADQELARFGLTRTETSIEVDTSDVALLPIGTRVWVQDIEAGVVDTSNPQRIGHWVTTPVAARIIGRTMPITAHCGVYLVSANTASFGSIVDLSDHVIPDDPGDGRLVVSTTIHRPTLRQDLIGRSR